MLATQRKLQLSLPQPEDIFREAAADGARPDSPMTVSQWADRYRFLSSKSAAEPGPWRTSRVPYTREIMDELSTSSPYEFVVLMKGAQIAGTELGNNWIGYVIHQAPAPTMAVMPTQESAQENSKIRITPMIDSTPELSKRVRPPRSRDAGNTLLLKEFTGGLLFMTGANSGVGLRSKPVRNLMLDEIDAYPPNVDGEGDPLKLALARTSTFGKRRKVFIPSTPLIAGQSKIEELFLQGDQRYYFVPCLSCGAMQVLKFAQLRWPKGEPTQAVYHCIECDAPHRNHHKTPMLERGQWRSTAPGDGRTASFHLSSLYSPHGWFSWEEMAAEWEQARGKPLQLQTFVNTRLGETFKERGEAPDWQILYARRKHWRRGFVPAGAVFLTAGADVQNDRIEIQIIAWGRNKQKWPVDYIILNGSPFLPAVWSDLSDVLNSTWTHASGVDLSLMRFAIDSGFATQEVYAWARRQAPGRVLVVKGQQQGSAAIGAPSPVDVNYAGKKIKHGCKVWPVATSLLKSELYGWLKMEAPTDGELAAGEPFPPGYFHFPDWLDEEYFQQLTAEQLMRTTTRAGFTKMEWVNTRPGHRNEALDTVIYARAAAAQYGLDRFSPAWWTRNEEMLWGEGGYTPERDKTAEVESRSQEPAVRSQKQQPAPPPPPAAPAPTSPHRNNWLGNRREGWIRR